MTKKKVILVAAAALFAVSGLTALPSGNITGGVGCIVVAAVCAYFGLKKKSAGKENENRSDKDGDINPLPPADYLTRYNQNESSRRDVQ
jgi:hypothetical protein